VPVAATCSPSSSSAALDAAPGAAAMFTTLGGMDAPVIALAGVTLSVAVALTP